MLLFAQGSIITDMVKHKNKFGYSDIRLWPAYSIYSVVMLLAIELFGTLIASIAVTALVAAIAIHFNSRDTKTWEEVIAEVDAYKEWANKPRGRMAKPTLQDKPAIVKAKPVRKLATA